MVRLLPAALLVACTASDPDVGRDPDDLPRVDGPTLQDVAFFQAVEVPVLRAGAPVEAAARSAPLIAGREAVVRARVALAGQGGAEALRLSVTTMDGGDAQVFTSDTRVEAGGVLVVDLPAAVMTATATFVVHLHTASERFARFPEEGDAALDALETGPLKLRLVPFEVNGFTPDTSAAVVDGMGAALMAAFPITEVELSVADVQPWEGALDLGDINVQVGVLQQDDMTAGRVSWDTYYYGLATGVASRDEYQGITGTSEDGGSEPLVRAYFAAGAAFGDARSEETLLHELGHVHGLLHTACDGEDNVDAAYPHEGGTIGVEGYDRRTGTFLPADTKDLMTYCAPRWISDYGFNKVAQHVIGAQRYRGYD